MAPICKLLSPTPTPTPKPFIHFLPF